MKVIIFSILGLLNIYNLDSVKHYVKSVGDVEAIVCQIRFIEDKEEGDEWLSPGETLKRGGDDCEGFALLTKELLDHIGCDTSLIRLYNDDTGTSHVIVTYVKWGGIENGFFSNGVRYKTSYLKKYVDDNGYKDWRYIKAPNVQE